MVDLVKRLRDNGHTYEVDGSIYYKISTFPDYGKLSGIDIDKIRLGATVDLDEYEKDNPRDFTLLKRSRLSELKRGIYTKTDCLPAVEYSAHEIGVLFWGDRKVGDLASVRIALDALDELQVSHLLLYEEIPYLVWVLNV